MDNRMANHVRPAYYILTFQLTKQPKKSQLEARIAARKRTFCLANTHRDQTSEYRKFLPSIRSLTPLSCVITILALNVIEDETQIENHA